MNLRNIHTLLLFTLLISFVLVSQSGCISENLPANTDFGSTDTNVTSGSVSVTDISDEDSSDGNGINTTSFTISVKKTGILELENNYSLKIIDIDKQNELVQVSLRKDGNEYGTRTMKSGSAYNIRDTRDEEVIYTISVDRILDNNFVVQLTCVLKPAIMLETGVYEGQIVKSEVRIGEDTITRTYRWKYENTDFSVTYEYNIEAYDMYSERSRKRDFTNFVNDPFDDELISQITDQMGLLARENGYQSQDIPYIAMAFVQSLPYVSDSASSGYDEYPRFPFETLYHGGGDCEDSSILLAALLKDMGYGVALIELPGHMAVGVKGNSQLEGNYYLNGDSRYYYLETTNSGWDVGVIPDEYANEEAIVMPVVDAYPELGITFSGTGQINKYVTYVDLDIEVENVGSAVAEDVIIYATLETESQGMVWDDLKTETGLDLNVEESLSYTVSNLKVPAGEKYRVGIWAWSSNSNSEYVYSDWTSS